MWKLLPAILIVTILGCGSKEQPPPPPVSEELIKQSEVDQEKFAQGEPAKAG